MNQSQELVERHNHYNKNVAKLYNKKLDVWQNYSTNAENRRRFVAEKFAKQHRKDVKDDFKRQAVEINKIADLKHAVIIKLN